MARQEVIDGPGVAAKILSRFPAEEREHLVAAIRAEAPKVAANLARRIVDFTRVDRIRGSALQTLLREIPDRDITISLKTAEEPTQGLLLENVSERTLEKIKEDISELPPMEVTDVEAAQARILKRLDELYPDDSTSNPHRPFKSRLA